LCLAVCGGGGGGASGGGSTHSIEIMAADTIHPWTRTAISGDACDEQTRSTICKGLAALTELAQSAAADSDVYAHTVRDMRQKQSRAQLFLRLCEHPDRQAKTRTTFSPLPSGEFSILLAKLPWTKRGSTSVSRRCLSIHDLAQLRPQSIAADDAVLCLWTNLERLQDTKLLGEWWGFTYVGVLFLCIQLVPNTYTAYQGTSGNWTRDNAEVILLFTRGNAETCVRDKHISQLVFCDEDGKDNGALQSALSKACNVTTAHADSLTANVRHRKKGCTALFFHPRMSSSYHRPKHIYGIMERLFQDFPRCELFATQTRAGWDSWGSITHHGPVPPFAQQLAHEEDASARARGATVAPREKTTFTSLKDCDQVDDIMRMRSKPGPKTKKVTHAKRKRKPNTKKMKKPTKKQKRTDPP
jgi:N6-adenosine-specific RNA methylase IME4